MSLAGTRLTGDHHGLIWATSEKHDGSCSWGDGEKAFAEGKGPCGTSSSLLSGARSASATAQSRKRPMTVLRSPGTTSLRLLILSAFLSCAP